MTFIKFINTFVEDEDFKKTINSLYDVWRKENPTFESTIAPQPQTTVSTANTPEQNAAAQNGQTSVKSRPIEGNLKSKRRRQKTRKKPCRHKRRLIKTSISSNRTSTQLPTERPTT